MAENLILYVETEKGARTALVKSGSANQAVIQMNPIVAGDTLPLNVYFLTNGLIETAITSGLYSVTASLGQYGTVFAKSNLVLRTDYAWTGSLDTNTGILTASLGTADSLAALLEVETYNSTTLSRRTYLQTPVQVYNQVVSQSVSS